MLFYEPLFLFIFFPTFYLFYIVASDRARMRLAVLLVASLFFYLWSEPLFVPVVLASGVLDYALGRRIARGTNAGALLTFGILANFGILFRYKYTGFLLDNLNGLLVAVELSPVHVGQVALPIGVSFIVFEKITYLVDIHRGRSRPAPNLPTYLLYVFFFPKLLAGPIIKYHEMDAQLINLPIVASADMVDGFGRFMLGVVKKTLLADTLSAGADNAFAADLHAIGFADAWLGVVFFTFQIYFEFFRLLRHGDRDRSHAGHPPAGELRHALHLMQHHRVLATLAHLSLDLDTRVSIYPARWQPGRACAAIPESLDVLSRVRPVARGCVDLRAMGCLQWAVLDARPIVPAARSRPRTSFDRERHHVPDHDDRMDHLPCPLARAG